MRKKLWIISISLIFYVLIMLGFLGYRQMQDVSTVYGAVESEGRTYFLMQEYQGNALELKVVSVGSEQTAEELYSLSLNNTFRLTDFSSEEQVLCVTGIEQLTGEIFVYLYDMTEQERILEKETYGSYARYAPVKAIYREETLAVMDKNGNIYTELQGVTKQDFVHQEVTKETLSSLKTCEANEFWKIVAIITIIYLLVVVILVVLNLKVFKKRELFVSIFSTVFISSTFVMMALFVVGSISYQAEYVQERKEKSEFYGMLQRSYYEQYGKLEDWTQTLDEEEIILYQSSLIQMAETPVDGAEVQSSSYQVQGSSVAECYGSNIVELLATAYNQSEILSEKVVLDGVAYIVSALPLTNEDGKMLLVTTSMMGLPKDVMDYQKHLLIVLIICWVLLNFVITIFLALKLRVLKKVRKNLELMVGGNYDWTPVPVPENELGNIYKLLTKVSMDMGSYQYASRNARGYYARFVPQGFEQLFGQTVLQEIAPGDWTQTNGIMLCVNMHGQEKDENINQLGRVLELLDVYRKSGQGIILTGQSELGRVRVVFRQEEEQADEAMIAGMELLGEINGMVFLHFSHLLCGMAGNDKVAVPFVRSDEVEWLTGYAGKLSNMGIHMVMTDEVKQMLRENYETRYIGYILSADKTRKVSLYEVLDGYAKDERYYKNATKELFENALTLFYQNDFYFARNSFLEVLKKCPEDGVARWYAFACDEMFNRENAEEIRHDLFFLDKEKGEGNGTI